MPSSIPDEADGVKTAQNTEQSHSEGAAVRQRGWIGGQMD